MLTVAAGGAVLLLQGCGDGHGHEHEVMAEQTCDGTCKIEFECDHGTCMRHATGCSREIGESICGGNETHPMTCDEFKALGADEECITTRGCCAYNSCLSSADNCGGRLFLQRYCKQRDRVPGWSPCGDGVRRCCLRRPAGASLVIPVLGSDSCIDIFISKLVPRYSAHDLMSGCDVYYQGHPRLVLLRRRLLIFFVVLALASSSTC